MDGIEKLIQYLQEGESYPCLHLLEAALASRRYRADGVIPEELIRDIRNALGDSAVQGEIANLLELDIFEEMNVAEERGIRLKEQVQPSVEDLLGQLRDHMELETGGGCMEAGEYLNQLMQYLQSVGIGFLVKENKKGDYLLELEGETYRFLLTLSPFWLPLAPEKSEEEEKYVFAFGPFASQSWEKIYPYYDFEEFRDRVALYDPWSREKMNLCKGSIPVYIDWFYRDQCKERFSISADFCEALRDMGLMRYNDER